MVPYIVILWPFWHEFILNGVGWYCGDDMDVCRIGE